MRAVNSLDDDEASLWLRRNLLKQGNVALTVKTQVYESFSGAAGGAFWRRSGIRGLEEAVAVVVTQRAPRPRRHGIRQHRLEHP